jgi:hypothetical protein
VQEPVDSHPDVHAGITQLPSIAGHGERLELKASYLGMCQVAAAASGGQKGRAMEKRPRTPTAMEAKILLGTSGFHTPQIIMKSLYLSPDAGSVLPQGRFAIDRCSRETTWKELDFKRT